MRPRFRTALAAVAVLLPASAMAQAQSAAGDLKSLSRALQRVAEKVEPTVVQIRVTAYGPVSGGNGTAASLIGTQRSTGSGVILSADGYIVTNNHVVEGGRKFKVILPRAAVANVPGRSAVAPVSQEVAATLVGADEETDLAVLKVDLAGLPFSKFADSDSLAPGQLVLAFGSPLGLAGSVSMGVVSAVGRQLREEDRMVYIQTDTPINPGNSGGPLVNEDGAVVGINTLILSQSGGNEGLGFAAPSNIARFVTDQLRANGRVRRGSIGVFAQTITPALAAGLHLPREWGVVLGDIDPNGPAAKSALQPGDMIMAVDGKPMENGRQMDVTLYRRKAGETVSLDVVRGPQRFTAKVPVVERKDDDDQFRGLVTPEKNLVPELGILGLDVTPELARAIPGARDTWGVVVAAASNDATRPAGLRPGDVIYSVNGIPTRTLADLRTALSQVAAEAPAILQVGRRGQLRFVTASSE
ncbi:MAG TPA: trypsin-like peptidase domain-containing protein [Gemmatimonadales bacterium]|nr:trypsin-like peptidase domain-containing protein [Gemmatimonadales bacterium]